MNEQEYNMRVEFADKFITGWQDEIYVKGCKIPYTKGNAHVLVAHMSNTEFAKAKANPKVLMKKLNPNIIKSKILRKMLLMLIDTLIGVFAAIIIAFCIGYITQSQISAALVAFIISFATSAYVQIKWTPFDNSFDNQNRYAIS